MKTINKTDLSRIHFLLFKKVIASIGLNYLNIHKYCFIHFKAILCEICAFILPLKIAYKSGISCEQLASIQ